MFFNIGKYNGKATDFALQFWKRLWQGDGTMICYLGKYSCTMAMQLDNAVQGNTLQYLCN
jgi:hypothetical protein